MTNEYYKGEEVKELNQLNNDHYNPDAVFRNKNISYFGGFRDLRIQYKEFTSATGFRKFINSIVVIGFFLIVEAVIVANYPPARDFISDFFAIGK